MVLKEKFRYYFFSLALILIPFLPVLAYEIYLRFKGTYLTYSENAYGYFYSYYGKTHPTHYHRWNPGQVVTRDFKEFKYEFIANSMGFRGTEFHKKKKANSLRILTIGDSFTEGFGTTNDSVISAQLSNLLNVNPKTQYEVWNAGIAGSDVFFCYQLFKDILKEFDIDIVLLIINSSDINDVMLCGGFERFLNDGTTAFKKAPLLLIPYKYSHVCRAIMHSFGYDDALLSPGQKNKETEVAIEKIAQCIVRFDSLSKARNIDFVAALHAFPDEHRYDFNTQDDIRKVVPYLEPNNTPHLVLHEPMSKYLNPDNIDSYAWPIDGHFNGKGYHIMAKCIFEEINNKYPELLQLDTVEETSQNTIDTIGHTTGLNGYH